MDDKKRAGEQRLTIRVTPNAGRSEITGWRDAVLQVKIAAPPEKGKANKELVELIGRALGVRRSAVSIVTGDTGRNKTITVEGMSREEIKTRIRDTITK